MLTFFSTTLWHYIHNAINVKNYESTKEAKNIFEILLHVCSGNLRLP